MQERTPNDILPDGAGIEYFIRRQEDIGPAVLIPSGLLEELAGLSNAGMAPPLDRYDHAVSIGDDEMAKEVLSHLRRI